MTEQEAKDRVKALKGFYDHLNSFIAVNAGLFILNMFTSPNNKWFLFPLMGWGIGLLSHALSVFPIFGKGKDWETRKLQELMRNSGEYVSASSLDNILEEKIGKIGSEKRATSSDPVVKKLIQRIEHLEAIVTTKDWEKVETFSERKPEIVLPGDDEPEENLSTEEKVSRIARKVL